MPPPPTIHFSGTSSSPKGFFQIYRAMPMHITSPPDSSPVSISRPGLLSRHVALCAPLSSSQLLQPSYRNSPNGNHTCPIIQVYGSTFSPSPEVEILALMEGEEWKRWRKIYIIQGLVPDIYKHWYQRLWKRWGYSLERFERAREERGWMCFRWTKLRF